MPLVDGPLSGFSCRGQRSPGWWGALAGATVRPLRRSTGVILVVLSAMGAGSTLAASPAADNPLSVRADTARLSVLLPAADQVRIAFIDLSRLDHPRVTVTNLRAQVISSFTLPQAGYDPDWVHWGPGIQHDPLTQSLWVLFPRAGYSQFTLNGDFLAGVPYPKASHQIQMLADGRIVSPFSWDTAEDAQVVEVARDGRVSWRWHAREYVETLDGLQSPAKGQPSSYTAAVSALKTPRGHYWVALAQRNVIVRVDSTGKVLESRSVSERPHALVVEGEDLVGYTLRAPNRVVIRNRTCDCMREHVLEEALPGRRSTRSLSLQKVGPGLWFVSAVTGLYLMTEEGDLVWRLRHSQLNGRPQGFHSAVFFELQ